MIGFDYFLIPSIHKEKLWKNISLACSHKEFIIDLPWLHTLRFYFFSSFPFSNKVWVNPDSFIFAEGEKG